MSKHDSNDVDERLQKLKNQDYICERNKELFTRFLHRLRAENETSSERNYKYVYTFDAIFKDFVDFPLDEASRNQMEEAVGKIHACDKSDYTKADYKVVLGKFYRTLWDNEVDRPENIQRILKSDLLKKSNHKIERQKEVEALTAEEVMNMVEEGKNPRDRLLPLFMFETGARISELLDIRLKDVELKKQFAQVTIPTRKNNKEPRTLTLTKCIGLLQDWMEKHPRKDQPDAPLLVNLTNRSWKNKANEEKDYMGKQMTGPNVRTILRKLADRAGIDKHLTNHVMRHSSATYWGREFGLETMMYWFGWNSPDTAKTYLHHDEEQVKKHMLNIAGINEEENKDPMENKVCPRCEEKNPPTSNYCSQCSMSLDQQAARKVKQLEEAGRHITRERMNGLDDEEIENYIIS